MDGDDTIRHEAVEALSWYAGQARAIAAGVAHPIRSAHILLDDSGHHGRRARRRP